MRAQKIFLALPVLLALSACGSSKPLAANQINNPQTQYMPPQNQAPSSFSDLFSFGAKKPAGQSGSVGVAVNAYLWRASLDTLSFMPLASADPFGGVIITDWYSPPGTPNERFKVNAFVLSPELSANGIRVSVFHQVRQGGGWADAPVDPATVSGLEDRILAHAAQLRAQASNNS